MGQRSFRLRISLISPEVIFSYDKAGRGGAKRKGREDSIVKIWYKNQYKCQIITNVLN
ncbi:Uncharacterised protein [Dorea longicatena]|uniref:Uncharacterized protein n=1 Tax=Dorea longicatena TaxID=88431 RepID=A0A564UBE8_9FIRM|nr:Uncharacterised protein [Dorea longicatena]